MPDETTTAPTPASAAPAPPAAPGSPSPSAPLLPEQQSQAPEQAAAPVQPTLWDQLTKQTAAPAAPAPDVAAQPENATELAAKKPREQRARMLADLTQREAWVASRDEELKKHEKELADYREALAGLKTDPLGTLEKAGLTYEQLTLAALKGKKGDSPELKAVRDELRGEIEGLKQAVKQREDEVQISAFKSQLRDHITGAGDKYELIVARGDFEKVWDTMVDISRESGGKVVPTFEQAASFYELKLQEQLEKDSEILMKTKKYAAKRGAAPGAPPANAPPAPAPAATANMTKAKPVVSNALSGTSADPSTLKPKTKDDAFRVFKEHMQKAFSPNR